MTDPLVEFRGLDLQSGSGVTSGICLDVTRGFLAPPSVRGADTVIPDRPGRVGGNRVSDLTNVVLEGYVRGNTAAEWRTYTDLLMEAIREGARDGDDPIDPGELIVRSPYLGLPATLEASITCRVDNAIPGPIIGGPNLPYRLQMWSVALVSIDPDWVIELGGS